MQNMGPCCVAEELASIKLLKMDLAKKDWQQVMKEDLVPLHPFLQ